METETSSLDQLEELTCPCCTSWPNSYSADDALFHEPTASEPEPKTLDARDTPPSSQEASSVLESQERPRMAISEERPQRKEPQRLAKECGKGTTPILTTEGRHSRRDRSIRSPKMEELFTELSKLVLPGRVKVTRKDILTTSSVYIKDLLDLVAIIKSHCEHQHQELLLLRQNRLGCLDHLRGQDRETAWEDNFLSADTVLSGYDALHSPAQSATWPAVEAAMGIDPRMLVPTLNTCQNSEAHEDDMMPTTTACESDGKVLAGMDLIS